MSLLDSEIATLALGSLGSTLTISNLSQDSSAQALIARRHFKTSMETLLERHDWGFASKIGELTLKEENPNSGLYAFSYRTPSDCLVVRKIGAEAALRTEEEYEDEVLRYEELYGTDGEILIYTDVPNAHVRYTRIIEGGYLFPNHVGRALAAQLAMDMAPSIITNNFAKVQNVLVVDAEKRIMTGIQDDLNRKPRPLPSLPRFVRVR